MSFILILEIHVLKFFKKNQQTNQKQTPDSNVTVMLKS